MGYIIQIPIELFILFCFLLALLLWVLHLNMRQNRMGAYLGNVDDNLGRLEDNINKLANGCGDDEQSSIGFRGEINGGRENNHFK